MIRWFLVAMLFTGTYVAIAAPPDPKSEDGIAMAPFKTWITSQRDRRGRWCCDIGDGRPVEARVVGNHWEAHVTPQHFPGERDRWMEIEDERIVKGNPTGQAILWLYHGQVQCFAEPQGV